MEPSATLPIPNLVNAASTASPAQQGDEESGDFAPGTVLGGSYRIMRRLGRGGMGDIHLASHERLPGQFVVKVLSPDLVSDEDAFVRFRQEAVVMANVRHPNVVQLVDFNFTMSGLPYLVMEFLPGKDLADILSTRPFLAAPQVSSIVRQVACALDAAHKLGIVHRDLKPENIMVVPCEGQGDLIKVIDFGISKARRFNHVTIPSMVMGTPEFMSPEQAQGRQEDVDARSDQFALSVISYLLLTGRTPWGVTAPVEILNKVVNSAPLPVTHDDGWRAVEAVLFRGMAKAPHERYPSTLAFWRALDRAMVSDGLLPAQSGYSPTIHGSSMDVARRGFASDRPDSAMDSEIGVSAPDYAAQASSDLVDEEQPPAESEAPPREGSVTTRFPLSKRKPKRGGKQAWQAVVLVMVLACGVYVGLQDATTVRSRAGGSWNSLRAFAVRAAERGIAEGARLFFKAAKEAKPVKAYVSVGTEP